MALNDGKTLRDYGLEFEKQQRQSIQKQNSAANAALPSLRDYGLAFEQEQAQSQARARAAAQNSMPVDLSQSRYGTPQRAQEYKTAVYDAPKNAPPSASLYAGGLAEKWGIINDQKRQNKNRVIKAVGYTPDNVMQRNGRIQELISKTELSDDERYELQAAYDATKLLLKSTMNNDKNDAGLWQQIGTLQNSIQSKLHPAGAAAFLGFANGAGILQPAKMVTAATGNTGKQAVRQLTQIERQSTGDAPLAAKAGGFAGNVAMLANVGDAVGGSKALAALSGIQKAAVTFGATSLYQSAVNQDWKNGETSDNIINVARDAVAGAISGYVGAGLSNVVGGAIVQKLMGSGISTKAIAALSAAGGGLAFGAASAGIQEAANIAAAKENGVEYQPDVGRIVKNVLASAIYSALCAYTKASFTMRNQETKLTFFTEEDLKSPEALQRKYRTLAKQNHPDIGGSEALMAQINAEYDAAKAVLAGRYKAGIEREAQAADMAGTGMEESTNVRDALALISMYEDTQVKMGLMPVPASKDLPGFVKEIPVDLELAEKTVQAQTEEAVRRGKQARAEREAREAVEAQKTPAAETQQTNIDTQSKGHTEEQQRIIQEYQGATDLGLVNFYDRSVAGELPQNQSYPLKNVGERAAEDIRNTIGVNPLGFKTVIEARMARHIDIDHGSSGASNVSMKDSADIGRIQYVLDNYDEMFDGGNSKAYTTIKSNGRAGTARTVIYAKAVDNTYYIIEAVPDTNAKTVYVVSAFLDTPENFKRTYENKMAAKKRRQLGNTSEEALPFTSKTLSTVSPDTSIPNNRKNSKGDISANTPASAAQQEDLPGFVKEIPVDLELAEKTVQAQTEEAVRRGKQARAEREAREAAAQKTLTQEAAARGEAVKTAEEAGKQEEPVDLLAEVERVREQAELEDRGKRMPKDVEAALNERDAAAEAEAEEAYVRGLENGTPTSYFVDKEELAARRRYLRGQAKAMATRERQQQRVDNARLAEREKYEWREKRRKERQEWQEQTRQTMNALKMMRKRLGYNDVRYSQGLEQMEPEMRAVADDAVRQISTSVQSLTEAAKKKIEENAELYERLSAEDPNYIPDKKTLALLERMDEKYLKDKTVEELQNIYRAVQVLRYNVKTIDEELGQETKRKFTELYQDSKQEITASKGRKPKNGAAKAIDEFLTEEQLTPMNYLEMLGGWNPSGTFYSMGKQLEAGERRAKQFTVDANKMFQPFREKYAKWIAKSDGQGKDATWYEIEVSPLLEWGAGDKPIFGKPVKVYLTPAMRVELARGIRSYDNLRHAEGGVTFPDRELYARGERAEAYQRGKTIRLAPESMKRLFSFNNLTDTEKELFILSDRFFDGMAKSAINETSQLMDGIDRAMSDHYSKIFTNANYRATDATKVDQSIGGMGSLQSRVQSKTPMLAMSIWEAYEDTVDTVSKYAGLAIPTRNFQKLLNWSEGQFDESLKNVIAQKWGGSAVKYLEDLLTELQNEQHAKKSGVDKLTGRLLNTYVTAIFGANPGIVLKQTSSIPSAASVLGWRTLPSPKQVKSADAELIAKYTPELEYRSMGYASPELTELKNNPNWTQKNRMTRFLFGGAITQMDRAAAKCLWPWAENAVKQEYPQLKEGTEEYYQKTAELFNEAVVRTQSMYDRMHSAKIMKGQSNITRAFTMFKSDAMQQQNMLRRAAGEAAAAKKAYKADPTEENKAKAKRAGALFGSTAAAVIVAALVCEDIDFLIQLLKNKARNYRDDEAENEITMRSFAKEYTGRMINNLSGLTLGGEELAGLLSAAWTGDRWYEIDVPEGQQLNDMLGILEETAAGIKQATDDIISIRKEGGSVGQYVEDHGHELLGGVKSLAQALSTYGAGLPAANIEKYILGVIDWVSPEMKAAYESLWEETTKQDLHGSNGKSLAVKTGQLLDSRMEGVGDAAKREIARLYETTGSDAAPPDIPASITVKGVNDEATTITLSVAQKQEYGEVFSKAASETINELIGSRGYAALDDEQKARAVSDLYRYANAAAAEQTVRKEKERWQEAAQQYIRGGGSLTDYLIFRAVESGLTADKDADGKTVDGSLEQKRVQAIDRMGIGDEKAAALYYATAAESKQAAYDALSKAGLKPGDIFALQADGYAVQPSLAKQTAAGKAQGIPPKDLYIAAAKITGMESDRDRNGKAVFGSRQRKVMEYIDALNLSKKQKDWMYVNIGGYTDKSVYEAPWNFILGLPLDLPKADIFGGFKLPEFTIPGVRMP